LCRPSGRTHISVDRPAAAAAGAAAAIHVCESIVVVSSITMNPDCQ